MENDKKLKRNTQNKVIGGVCSGLADYFGIDTALMRVIFVLLFLFGCSGFLIYLILWIAIPDGNTPQNQQFAEVRPTEPSNGKGGWVAGLLLVLLGCCCLIGNLVPSFSWRTYWPVLLILAGLILIVPFKNKKP